MKELLTLLLFSSAAFAQIVPPLRLQNNGTNLRFRYKLNLVNSGCVDNAGTKSTDCTFGVATPSFFWSGVTIASQGTATVGDSAGDITASNSVAFTQTGTVTGARIYWADAGTTTVTIKLRDSGGTLQKSCTIAASAVGVYTCSFASGFAITSSNVFKRFFISMYDGNFFPNISVSAWAAASATAPNPSTNFANSAGPNSFMMAPFLYLFESRYAAGDAAPTNSANGGYYLVEPTFTQP